MINLKWVVTVPPVKVSAKGLVGDPYLHALTLEKIEWAVKHKV